MKIIEQDRFYNVNRDTSGLFFSSLQVIPTLIESKQS